MQELHATGVRPVEIAVMCQINDTCPHDQFLARPLVSFDTRCSSDPYHCMILLDSCDLIQGTVLRLYPKALRG